MLIRLDGMSVGARLEGRVQIVRCRPGVMGKEEGVLMAESVRRKGRQLCACVPPSGPALVVRLEVGTCVCVCVCVCVWVWVWAWVGGYGWA